MHYSDIFRIKQNDWDKNETIYGWKRVIKNGVLNIKL